MTDRVTERRKGQDDEAATLPSRSRDDSDVGWGDPSDDDRGERDAEWYRRERPPHHDRD